MNLLNTSRRLAAFLFAVSVCSSAMAQGSGTVKDSQGQPVIGASVMIKGTSQGTVTDMDGRFSLPAAKRGQTLVISSIGLLSQQVPVAEGINLTLQDDVASLDDVVVVGYGTMKKRDLTGAITSLKSDDITIAPTSNVMEALQGKVAGMDIMKSSGAIGSGVDIQLRGTRSIYGDNTPLFIIDGLPGSYDSLNPNDIESIDVLKDASATAIYGSAGSNGVVIITTKHGAEAKTKVNFDAYFGFSGGAKFKSGMQGDEWTNYYREAYKYRNGSYPENVTALLNGNQDYVDAYNGGKWIDWVDQASGRTATTQKYALSVQGGTAKTKVYTSLVYNRDEGLLENEKQDRYSMRVNIDQTIAPWAVVGASANLVYTIRDAGVKNTFTQSLKAFPLGDPRGDAGELNYEYIQNQYTPLGDYIKDQYANNTRNTFINAIAYVELTPLKGLKFRSQFNGTLDHSRLGQYWGAQCNANRPSYAGTPHASIHNTDSYKYNWENILNYNLTVARDHDLSFTGVTSWQKNSNEFAYSEGSGQNLDVWQYWRLMAATGQHIESDFGQTQKMSLAVRVNYSYKGRYLATFSNRWDGVSFFSEGKKWDSFPAAALAWRISDEKFMESTRSWLDNLKLRIGAGITGNSGGVGAYATQTNAYAYTGNGITINGKSVPFTQYTGTLGSTDLGWEKSYNWNFGLDYSVFGGRIDGSFEFFTTVTRGLLYKRQMPITDGVTGWGAPLSSWQNLAKTSNKGFEMTVNSRNIKTKDFAWNTTLTASWQRECIDHLLNGDLPDENLFEGQPIHSIYDYQYEGIWGTDTPQEVLTKYGVEPGWVKIATNAKGDDQGEHKYSKDDRRVLGHTNPNWIFGLGNTFTYKGFDLTVYLMARLGQTIQSKLLGYYDAKSTVTTNQLSGIDYWTEDNQGAFYPRPGIGDKQSIGLSALAIEDGSFMKVKNITLGYTLPRAVSHAVRLDRCRFYFTAYNPFIVCNSRLKGTDPETGGSDAFPTYKQFVFGINLTM